MERRVGAERLPVAVSGAPEAALPADFADGIGARVGVGWQATTDGMRGGSSVARLSAERGASRVEGEIVEGFAFPWAGTIYFPGEQPMQPVDFSNREMLRFWTRGDGRTDSVMLLVRT